MATSRSLKQKALQDKSKELVILAHKYNPKKHIVGPGTKRQVDITGWEIYEKIDGIRAIYKEGMLLSRYGNKFSAPEEFLEAIEEAFGGWDGLDGELVSIKGFQHTTSVVRDQTTKNIMKFWKDIRYVVFDYKDIDPYIPFRDREVTLDSTYHDNKYIKLLWPLGKVKNSKSIPLASNKIAKKGGEGLILRNPGGLYITGRSRDLLKVKPFEDTEAKVVGYFDGEGRNEGRIGGLKCILDDGTEFECGTGLTDADRVAPPSVGSIITVRYMGRTEGNKSLRHPVYIGKRDYE